MRTTSSNAAREAEERLRDYKPIEISDEQRHRDRIDGFKLLFDLLKHVTTLAAGSAVLVATLIDRVFPDPTYRWIVTISLVCFLLALLFAGFGMLGYATKIRKSNPRNDEEVRDMGVYSAATTLVAFTLGIAMLAVFSALNLWRG